MRMNGFGYALRDTGHNRVPEPPDKITGINIDDPSCGTTQFVQRRVQPFLPTW